MMAHVAESRGGIVQSAVAMFRRREGFASILAKLWEKAKSEAKKETLSDNEKKKHHVGQEGHRAFLALA
jgi:hypothetical protein